MLTEMNFTLKKLITQPEKRSDGFCFQPRLGTILILNLESIIAIDHTDFETRNWLGKKCLFSETAFCEHLIVLDIQSTHEVTFLSQKLKAADYDLQNRI